jgi:HEAT repeat protein
MKFKDGMEQPDFAELTSEQKLEIIQQMQIAEDYGDHQSELATLAADADSAVRQQAVEVFWEVVNLGDVPEEGTVDLLISIARSDPSLPVRTAAISALGRFVYRAFVEEDLDEEEYDRIRDCLVEMYRNLDEDSEVRRRSVESLGFITDPDIEEIILEAYGSRNHLMRVSAVFAMGRSGTRNWDDILMRELENSDSELRFEAVRAAGETYMTRASELLERLTEDPDREIKLTAIESLGKAGRPHSHAVLQDLARSSDEEIREAASEALLELDQFENEPFSDD